MENEIELTEEQIKERRKKLLFTGLIAVGALIVIIGFLSKKDKKPLITEKPKKAPRPINVIINNGKEEKPKKAVKSKKPAENPLEGAIENEEINTEIDGDDNSDDNE